MTELEEAIELAVEAHKGDTDKGGATYIRHPLRVMGQMDTEQERIVAVLHDVVEDSEEELEEIERKFGEEICEALDALTKAQDDDVDYVEEYIPNIASNPLARKVKQADLRDNLDVTRLTEIDDDMFDNIQKYHKSLQYLENHEDSTGH